MKNRWHSSGQPRKALATVRPRISPKMGAMGLGGAEGAIETHGLRRVFKTRKQVVEAVAGVDLTVQNAEILDSSGPTAPARRPRCGCSPPCYLRAEAPPPSPDSTCSRSPAGCGRSLDTSARPAA